MKCKFCDNNNAQQCENQHKIRDQCGNLFCDNHGDVCKWCGVSICKNCLSTDENGYFVCWKHQQE